MAPIRPLYFQDNKIPFVYDLSLTKLTQESCLQVQFTSPPTPKLGRYRPKLKKIQQLSKTEEISNSDAPQLELT